MDPQFHQQPSASPSSEVQKYATLNSAARLTVDICCNNRTLETQHCNRDVDTKIIEASKWKVAFSFSFELIWMEAQLFFKRKSVWGFIKTSAPSFVGLKVLLWRFFFFFNDEHKMLKWGPWLKLMCRNVCYRRRYDSQPRFDKRVPSKVFFISSMFSNGSFTLGPEFTRGLHTFWSDVKMLFLYLVINVNSLLWC